MHVLYNFQGFFFGSFYSFFGLEDYSRVPYIGRLSGGSYTLALLVDWT